METAGLRGSNEWSEEALLHSKRDILEFLQVPIETTAHGSYTLRYETLRAS